MAAAACAAAALARCLRQRCFHSASSLLGCCWTRGRLGRLAGGSTCPSDAFFGRGGAALVPAPQLGPASLCRTARLQRQLLLEGGGGVTRRQPRFGPAVGDFGAEPAPWRAVAAACAAAARAPRSAAAGPDGASGGSPAGDHARASVCGGCGGAALVPTPQLAEAGLCSQARLRRCCCVERRHGATLAGTWLGRGAASAWRRGPGSAAVGKTVAATSGAAFGRQRLGGVSSLLGRS